MTISLPPDCDALIRAKAEAHGFGDDLRGYLAQLSAQDDILERSASGETESDAAE